jgi:hypothetical protein
MDASTAPSPPKAKDAILKLADFSDRLSPMLVKELRQGLRTKFFVGVFLFLHAMMMFFTLPAILSEGSRSSESYAFWIITGLSIASLLPLGAVSAVYQEKQGNTLDTLVLTKLDARRIVMGKWASVVSRILLVGVTILPYLMIRYFGGGANLVAELTMLAILLPLAMLNSALVISFSGNKQVFVRGLLSLGAAVLTGMLVVAVVIQLFGMNFYSGGNALEWPLIVFGIATAFFLSAYFLESGAATIAPAAENRTTLRRLLTFGYLGFVILLFTCVPEATLNAAFDHDVEETYAMVLVILGWVMVDALVEPISNLWAVYQPFQQRGLLGRLSYLVLAPGWHSGVFFSLLLFPAALLPLFLSPVGRGLSMKVGDFNLMVLFMAQLLFVAVLLRLMRYNYRFVGYWILQGILIAAVTFMCAMSDSFDAPGLNFILAPVPISLIGYVESGPASLRDFTGLSWAYLAFYAVVLSGLAWRAFLKQRRERSTGILELPEAPTAR